MRCDHGVLRCRGVHAEAAQVVVAVALDMGDAEQGHDAEVLQQGHGADVGEVFAAEDGATANDRAALLEQSGVREAFDDAFAVLVAGAAIAEIKRAGKIGEGAVAFINDHAGAFGPGLQRGGHVIVQCL